MTSDCSLQTLGEVGEVCGSQGGGVRLGPGEVRQVLGLRTDFRQEDIKKLRLT